jgi:hypothetical protein
MNATTTGRPLKPARDTFWSELCAASAKSGAALPAWISMGVLLGIVELQEQHNIRRGAAKCSVQRRRSARIMYRLLATITMAPAHSQSSGNSPQMMKPSSAAHNSAV